MKNHQGVVNAALRKSAVLSELGVLAFLAVLLTSCGGSADPNKVDPSTLANTSGALPTSPMEIVGVPFDKRYACFIWGGSTSCTLGEWRDGFPLTASGGVEPYQWTWAATAGSSLPPGLSITTRTYHKRDYGTHLVPYNVMAIAGIPTQAGDFNVIVTVTDSASRPAHVSTPYTIQIIDSTSFEANAASVGALPKGSTSNDADEPKKHHTHYRVVDTGSFGGPNSHVSLGAHVLNNDGTFTGYADTALPDPYAPDGCWDGDCLVAHVFRWKNGELSDLGVLDGGPNSESNWMSENGLIAGDSQNGLLDPLVGFWQIRGVLWKDGQIIDVGTLGGGHNSLERGVNRNGVVAGLSTTTVPDSNAMIMSFGLPYAFQTHAFRWKDGQIWDLGTLGGPDAIALGVNEGGQIFGNSYTSLDPSPVCGIPDFGFDALTTGAFLWQEGKMTNLGSLGGTCTKAFALNNRGQVVGYSFLTGDQIFHPFSWKQGKLVDLGTTGGGFGGAATLNNAGDIVGWQSLPGNDNIFHAALWSHGKITDLGALEPDQCSFPSAINSRQQIVGLSGNCDFFDPSLRAFLWEPGGPMIDLNTLISPNLGIQLRNVATINDRGEMAAVAFFPDGSHRPVLLIPCGDQAEESEDCRDAVSLGITPSLQGTSTKALSRNDPNTKSVLAALRAVRASR